MLQATIDRIQEFVTGSVRLKLYKGDAAGFTSSMRCACAPSGRGSAS
jgi:argininosuccinate synthase